jgi:DNA-binding MarR family transcriptional regulator
VSAESEARLAAELGHGISQLFRMAGRAKSQLADGISVEWSTFVILAPLMECGPQRSSALAEMVHLDPSRVSRMISHSIERGLVDRRPDPADGRAAILHVTADGKRVFDDLSRRRDEYFASVVAHWSERDRRTLAALMSRLASDLGESLQSHETHAAKSQKLETA